MGCVPECELWKSAGAGGSRFKGAEKWERARAYSNNSIETPARSRERRPRGRGTAASSVSHFSRSMQCGGRPAAPAELWENSSLAGGPGPQKAPEGAAAVGRSPFPGALSLAVIITTIITVVGIIINSNNKLLLLVVRISSRNNNNAVIKYCNNHDIDYYYSSAGFLPGVMKCKPRCP